MKKLFFIIPILCCLYLVPHYFYRQEISNEKIYNKLVEEYFASFDEDEIAEYQQLVAKICQRIKDLKNVYPHFQRIDEVKIINEDNSISYDTDILLYMAFSYAHNVKWVARTDAPARASLYSVIDPANGVYLDIQFTIGGRNYEDPRTFYKQLDSIGALKVEMRLNPDQKAEEKVHDVEISSAIQRIITEEKIKWELNPNRRRRDALYLEKLR